MRVRLSRTRWLVIIVAVLGLVGFWGWRHFHEDHDHDDHANEAKQEAPVAGQVKLTPEAVQLAKIETAPVLLGPLDNRVSFTGELVFNEERLAKIQLPGTGTGGADRRRLRANGEAGGGSGDHRQR